LFVELFDVARTFLVLLIEFREFIFAFSLQFLRLRETCFFEVAQAVLELPAELVAIQFEFLQKVSVELLQVVRLFLLGGVLFGELLLCFAFEPFGILVLLGSEFGNLVVQLRCLLGIRNFEFVHDVFVELLDVSDFLQTVGFGFLDVFVEFEPEFFNVLGQRVDGFVFVQEQFLVVVVQRCERLIEVAGSRSAVEEFALEFEFALQIGEIGFEFFFEVLSSQFQLLDDVVVEELEM